MRHFAGECPNFADIASDGGTIGASRASADSPRCYANRATLADERWWGIC
jgi:hypothetical protein